MSTQWNQQLNRYVSKVIECLEQNIRKQIDCKRLSNTKQITKLNKHLPSVKVNLNSSFGGGPWV